MLVVQVRARLGESWFHMKEFGKGHGDVGIHRDEESLTAIG